jgi:hypothetical protein
MNYWLAQRKAKTEIYLQVFDNSLMPQRIDENYKVSAEFRIDSNSKRMLDLTSDDPDFEIFVSNVGLYWVYTGLSSNDMIGLRISVHGHIVQQFNLSSVLTKRVIIKINGTNRAGMTLCGDCIEKMECKYIDFIN